MSVHLYNRFFSDWDFVPVRLVDKFEEKLDYTNHIYKGEENDEDFNFSENNDLLADEWNGEDTEFNYEDPSGNNIAEPDDDLGEM